MKTHNHAVVWIDHRIAKIFFLGLNDVDTLTVQAHLATEHLHHKANAIGSGREGDDPTFLRRVEDALGDSEEVLVLGPGTEKASLVKCLKLEAHAERRRNIEIKPCDHPTDREMIALGRHYFRLGEPAR